jgi:MFS family permease
MSEFRQRKSCDLAIVPADTNATRNESTAMTSTTLTRNGVPEGSSPFYHGWLVVAVATLVALFGWGLGFYGPAVYLVVLKDRFSWNNTQVSAAITVYYLVAAVIIMSSAKWFEHYGARKVVATGIIAMACGAAGLGLVSQQWHVPIAFLALSVGWAFMSGAAINIIVAPWFDRRRGLAVSLALTGSGLGGIVVVPALLAIRERYGFPTSVYVLSAAMLLIALPAVLAVLRPKRPGEHDRADQQETAKSGAAEAASSWSIGTALRDIRFVSISAAFAIALMAQVGFLTHQIAFLSPIVGTGGAAWAIGLMVATAMLWRISTGSFIDSVDARTFSFANFLVQALAMVAFLFAEGSIAIYLASCLVGLSIGNMIALPGIVLQREVPRAYFVRAIALVVGINQFTFAFGPALLGLLRDASGSYRLSIAVCCVIQLVAAAIIVVPKIVRTNEPLYKS